MRYVPLLALAGCCGRESPTWGAIEPVTLGPDDRVTVDLAARVTDDGAGLDFVAEAEDGVLATVQGSDLVLVPEQNFLGESEVTVTVTDACGNSASTTVAVTVTEDGQPAGEPCAQQLSYEARGDAQAVYVAGSFNGWDPTATPMRKEGDRWVLDVDLPPGSYPYKFVEVDYTTGTQSWTCDPEADFVQCDEGYTWDPTCPLGGASCNSLLVVRDCSVPVLTLTRLDIDREANAVTAEVSVTGEVASGTVTLDGEPVDGWTGSGFAVSLTGLSEGRHTLRFDAENAEGGAAEQVYVPFWLDDVRWEEGLLYYVFVDRFADGDPARNHAEGTSSSSTDYLGGDWQGVIDRLDYLEDLGVTVLWLTAPQDNPSGAWEGQCNSTYSGYHGYWPADPFAPEEHFGDEATLHDLIDAAHARGMRVLTDWVANHVHQDHPYALEHPDWFNPLAVCGDANNWNDIPETCWFDDYLPDIRYYDVEPLERMVDDAVAWVKEYELDGYRVDAVKHMPHSVFWNFAARMRLEVEHRAAGGDEDFYTVGETYSGDRGLIGAYVNEDELDGQFDFPLYWAIVSAFARDEIGLSDGEGSLQDVLADSREAFAGHLMSTFLGNHDVARFLAQATGEIGSVYGDSPCGGDGNLRGTDGPESDPVPYQRLMLAWTMLLTTEGLPLIYYGDEIGLPGYNDPDNRQMMRFDDQLSANERMVLEHVRALGQARRQNRAFSTGTRVDWWEGEADVWAWARVNGDDQVLVILNRSPDARTLANGLGWAGLSGTSWEDVLTGDTFTASGDLLTVTVPGRTSRVLVPR